jgi:hypothetical protein
VEQFIELCVSFPVVLFTATLVFALAWWVVTTIAGGLDTDGGVDGDGDGLVEDLSDTLGAGGIPGSVALSILAFGGWVAALALTAVVDSRDVAGTTMLVVGIVIVVLALVVGAILLRILARPLRPLFVTETAPSIDGAKGAFAKVRSARLDEAGGEVIITSGPLRASVVRARTEAASYRAGDLVHVVDRDDGGVFIVCDIDASLT